MDCPKKMWDTIKLPIHYVIVSGKKGIQLKLNNLIMTGNDAVSHALNGNLLQWKYSLQRRIRPIVQLFWNKFVMKLFWVEPRCIIDRGSHFWPEEKWIHGAWRYKAEFIEALYGERCSIDIVRILNRSFETVVVSGEHEEI
jgi:hypothetical protein